MEEIIEPLLQDLGIDLITFLLLYVLIFFAVIKPLRKHSERITETEKENAQLRQDVTWIKGENKNSKLKLEKLESTLAENQKTHTSIQNDLSAIKATLDMILRQLKNGGK